MADILEKLATLNKTFQSDYLDVSTMFNLLKAEVSVFIEMFIDMSDVDVNAMVCDGLGFDIIPNYGPIDSMLATLRASIRYPNYRSIKLHRLVDNSDLEATIHFQKQFCNSIIDNLNDRFLESGIISCFKILSLVAFPKMFASSEQQRLTLLDYFMVKKNC